MHEVVVGKDCPECIQLEFKTPILLEDDFRVEAGPDTTIPRCGLSRVFVHPDGVVLALSQEADESVRALRDRLAAQSRESLILGRFAKDDDPEFVMFAEDLHRVIALFHFDSPESLEQFLAELAPDPNAVLHREDLLTVDPLPDSAVRQRAMRLHEELKIQFSGQDAVDTP